MTGASARDSVVNAAIYQIGWFCCVLGAANGWAFEGALVALGLAAVHLVLARNGAVEAKLLLSAGLLGIVLDTAHSWFGVLSFNAHSPGQIAPLWIIALWVQFGTVLHFCMNWLSRRYLLAALLGSVGGPLSFLGGERLGAAALGEPRVLAVAVLALSWSIALPTLVWLADRLGGRGSYRLPWRSGERLAALFN